MEPVLEPGRRLETDLQLIREVRGISIDEVYRTSRIPLEMLNHFERHGLENHPLFNEVYTRAFVRTYAQAIGVPLQEAMNALEAQRRGQYRGELAMRYLGWTPPDPPPGEEPSKADVEEKTPSDEVLRPVTQPVAEPPAPPPPPVPLPSRTVPSPAEVPVIARRSAAMWVVGLIVVAILVGGLVWYFMQREAEEATDPAGEDAATVTLAPPPSASVPLPDSLELLLIAEGGPIRGTRVRYDMDIRRPYWIEPGDSMVFAFTDSILVEATANVSLRLQGHPYRFPPGTELVRITRPRAQVFLDSLEAGR